MNALEKEAELANIANDTWLLWLSSLLRNDCKNLQVTSGAVSRWAAQQLLRMNLYKGTCTNSDTTVYTI